MSLLKKRSRVPTSRAAKASGNDGLPKEEKALRQRCRTLRLLALSGTVATFFGCVVYTAKFNHLRTSDSSSLKLPNAVFEIDWGVQLSFEFDGFESDSKVISLGPHKATMKLTISCPSPGLWLRMEGDALAAVVMEEKTRDFWEGPFTMPVAGDFSVVAYWYGCECNGRTPPHRKVLLNMTARGKTVRDPLNNRTFFPASVWLPSKKFVEAKAFKQPYVWHSPEIPFQGAHMLKTDESFVTKDSATYPDTEYYRFKELSNYELVCWVGSESAELLHQSFLQLRSLVNVHQRPFKFHLYGSSSFSKPDTSWTEEAKKKFRKCKHILISMDQLEKPSTQTEYVVQVTNFIGHLLRAFPDDTFPIWMFTVMESPAGPTSCTQPVLPRSSHHSCNTALLALFRNSTFPKRVRLMDATDISLPQFGENPKDVAAAIALRIFVLVGAQVAEWRSRNQVGTVDGLQRGAHLEPNFELVPYMDWAN